MADGTAVDWHLWLWFAGSVASMPAGMVLDPARSEDAKHHGCQTGCAVSFLAYFLTIGMVNWLGAVGFYATVVGTR